MDQTKLHEIQIQLETQQVEDGIARYKRAVDKAKESKHLLKILPAICQHLRPAVWGGRL